MINLAIVYRTSVQWLYQGRNREIRW